MQHARKTDLDPGEDRSAEASRPTRPELQALPGGLHLPGAELIEEALVRGATRTRRAIRATVLASALGLAGLALGTAIADALFLAIGLTGAGSAAGAFLTRESGLLRVAGLLRSLAFLVAVVLVFSAALIGVVSLL